VIDIDENDIRPVSPKRRPRPSDDGTSNNNGNSDRPRNRNSESNNFGDTEPTASSGRRRRPSSRASGYSNNDVSDPEDF
jgi:hypothetical protein